MAMGICFRMLVVATVILVGLVAVRAGQGGATRRLTPSDIADLARSGPGAGTSGVAGIQTTILSGNPTGSGLYTIRLNVPANTKIDAHTHRDDRSATVISGTWYLGYGPRFDDKALEALPTGSF
jgi:uncharacterized RmlC-like cupin family protein